MAKPTTKTISASLEDYLEAIYSIIEQKNSVKAIEISRMLGVGRSSVTEALKNLADKKLVNYGRYDAISLTSEGEKAAKEVIFKHNTLYDFFTNILGLCPDVAHENACRVEHVLSEEAMEKFVSFVDFHKGTEAHEGCVNKFKQFCSQNCNK
jgi:DtxR family Mn-dependent transcriptional regulator